MATLPLRFDYTGSTRVDKIKRSQPLSGYGQFGSHLMQQPNQSGHTQRFPKLEALLDELKTLHEIPEYDDGDCVYLDASALNETRKILFDTAPILGDIPKGYPAITHDGGLTIEWRKDGAFVVLRTAPHMVRKANLIFGTQLGADQESVTLETTLAYRLSHLGIAQR
ncbi:MAG: hypothetical protein IVW51_07225 [Thermaceae bacterium]|nr:hypothetical protein [Thermaceae bacterium]